MGNGGRGIRRGEAGSFSSQVGGWKVEIGEL